MGYMGSSESVSATKQDSISKTSNQNQDSNPQFPQENQRFSKRRSSPESQAWLSFLERKHLECSQEHALPKGWIFKEGLAIARSEWEEGTLSEFVQMGKVAPWELILPSGQEDKVDKLAHDWVVRWARLDSSMVSRRTEDRHREDEGSFPGCPEF